MTVRQHASAPVLERLPVVCLRCAAGMRDERYCPNCGRCRR